MLYNYLFLQFSLLKKTVFCILYYCLCLGDYNRIWHCFFYHPICWKILKSQFVTLIIFFSKLEHGRGKGGVRPRIIS